MDIVRIVYADGSSLSKTEHVRKDPDHVFAVIGPFKNHQDCAELQAQLTMLLSAWNRSNQ